MGKPAEFSPVGWNVIRFGAVVELLASTSALALCRLRSALARPRSWDDLRWAKLLADLRAAGHAMPIKDSLIAATALVHGMTVATRNVRDFRRAGVKIVNPFA